MADSFKVIIAALCITVACHLVQTFPKGAPDQACDTMRPGHHTTKSDDNSPLREPTTGTVYYSFHFDRASVRLGETITVMIHADDTYSFKGFLMQVRDVNPKISDNDKVIKYGTFTPVNGSDTQSVCSNQGITHNPAKTNNAITVTWTAPNEEHENLHFIATVVKDYEIFFMNVTSAPFKVSNNAVAWLPSLGLFFCMIIFHTLMMTS